MNSKTTLLLTSLISLAACNTTGASNETALKLSELTGADLSDQDLAGYTKAYFASGCFWCVEEVFESVRGVAEVVSGYAGGKEQNPTYEQVGRGATGHAEAVEVYYDPKVVSFQTLVDVFFASQDPTTPNRQGPDAGTQYRSIAFFTTPEEKAQIEATIIKLNASGTFDDPSLRRSLHSRNSGLPRTTTRITFACTRTKGMCKEFQFPGSIDSSNNFLKC